MGMLDKFFGEKGGPTPPATENAAAEKAVFHRPYKNNELSIIYNLLFCDGLSLYRDHFKGTPVSPWHELFLNPKQISELEKIANDPQTESRIRILAFNEWRRLGAQSPKKELLGVIVEVGMPDGLDVLAVYRDHTARYINYSERMIIWENAQDAGIDGTIAELFRTSGELVSRIGPWDKDRLPPPKNGEARITFLVSDGLYFGYGPFDALFKDSMGGRVLTAASELMALLINKSLAKA